MTEGAAVDRSDRVQIRRFTSFEAMKAGEYTYWQIRPGHERLAATSKISTDAFRMKGAATHVSSLQRALVHLKRA